MLLAFFNLTTKENKNNTERFYTKKTKQLKEEHFSLFVLPLNCHRCPLQLPRLQSQNHENLNTFNPKKNHHHTKRSPHTNLFFCSVFTTRLSSPDSFGPDVSDLVVVVVICSWNPFFDNTL